MSFEWCQHKTGEDLSVISHFTANEGATVGILGPKSMQFHSVGSNSSATIDRSGAYPATCSLSLSHHPIQENAPDMQLLMESPKYRYKVVPCLPVPSSFSLLIFFFF